jgi:glycerate 2-kinase
MQPRALLIDSFHAAIAAADPRSILPKHLPSPPKGRTLVLGAGKAAAAMALAVEQHWPAAAPLDGLVITRYRHGLLTNRIKVLEAGHPVPDEAGEAAARETLRLAKSLGAGDLLIVLVSGGGSALLSLPAEGLSMEDLKTTTRELLRCGAPIQEMNTVRKHLSAILGGRLAAACKAKVVALLISDVAGDDATHIASGPCAPDPTTCRDALDILDQYAVKTPDAVRAHLDAGVHAGMRGETPKPGDKLFARVENRVIATAQASLQAASSYFALHGIPAIVLGDSVSGEARDVARVYGALVRQVVRHGEPRPSPLALISGGECTVTVRGSGRGGRCTEFLLSLAVDLASEPGVWALAADTDGIDGTEENAGAVLSPDTLSRATRIGLDPRSLAADNDAWRFFSALEDLVVTGPTRTNVNDYRVILATGA